VSMDGTHLIFYFITCDGAMVVSMDGHLIFYFFTWGGAMMGCPRRDTPTNIRGTIPSWQTILI
jgi:hypothetical protein